MEIISLQIQNFLTIGAQVSLNLANQGLVLIQGINEDDTSAGSNGAGKSTIADALCWVNYDETARGESGDAVVNDTAKKDCYVREVIKDGDVFYDITRYRKHKEFKNQTVVNVWNDPSGVSVTNISKGTEKETQELINEILGCSHSVFVAAIYAGQEETPDIPRMTDKQLKMLIEEAAGVERLEQAYEIARKEALTIQDKINTINSKKANVSASWLQAEQKLATAQALFNLFEDGRKARSDAHKLTAVGLATKTKVLVSDLAKEQPEALKTRLAELKTQVDNVGALQTKYKELQQRFNAKVIGVSNHKIIMEGVMSEMKKHQFAHDNAETEMAKPCVACGKSHDASELIEFKAHQMGELKKFGVIYGDKQKELTGLNDRVIESRGEMILAEDELAKVNPTEVLSQSNEINAKLSWIAQTEAQIARDKQDISLYAEKSKSSMTELNPEKKVVDFIHESIDSYASQIDAIKADYLLLEDEALIADAQVKVFGPAGVRAHILDTVTPFLNDRTSDYLSALSDGNITAIWTTLATTAKGELREKFNIEVANEKGGKSFKLLSGGEKRKVRLATMLALQDLVASRATKPIQLWIGDEIDDALDSAGLERLMGILERKARERGTVLVISHNELSDWVDNVITVTKRGGFSTVEGALCSE